MTDFLLLTKEEVREAREEAESEFRCHADGDCFLAYDERCKEPEELELGDFCRLCKVLTEFAKGEVLKEE